MGGGGCTPPVATEKGPQGDERKGDRRLPVEPRREQWLATVLKRKGIRSAAGVSRGNTLARRGGGGAFNESGERPKHGECYHAGEDNLSVIQGMVELPC